jgi:hypothetical protein
MFVTFVLSNSITLCAGGNRLGWENTDFLGFSEEVNEVTENTTKDYVLYFSFMNGALETLLVNIDSGESIGNIKERLKSKFAPDANRMSFVELFPEDQLEIYCSKKDLRKRLEDDYVVSSKSPFIEDYLKKIEKIENKKDLPLPPRLLVRFDCRSK